MLSHRIISATVGIIYIILMLYIGGWFFRISVLLMALIAMYEFYRALSNRGYNPVKLMGYVALLGLYTLMITGNSKYVIPTIALTTIIAISLPIIFKSINIIDITITLFAIIYPGAMMLYLVPLGFSMQEDLWILFLIAHFYCNLGCRYICLFFRNKIWQEKTMPYH